MRALLLICTAAGAMAGRLRRPVDATAPLPLPLPPGTAEVAVPGAELGPEAPTLRPWSAPGQDAGSSGRASYAVAVEPASDVLVRATAQLESQVEATTGIGPDTIQVTRATCTEMKVKTGAMSCSLVEQISGYPEGCECQLVATKCPKEDKGLGFTGVSPSSTMALPEMDGLTVILCMYWQWLPGRDHSKEVAKQRAESTRNANQYVKAAHIYAEGTKGLADTLWALTVAPWPTPSVGPAGGPAGAPGAAPGAPAAGAAAAPGLL